MTGTSITFACPLPLWVALLLGACALAVVVVFGLTTSTLLTLFVIPAVYGWFEGKRRQESNGDVSGPPPLPQGAD